MNNTPQAFRFRVKGVVQGVSFRLATQAHAQSLGLDGWVRNRADGSVEGEARGTAAAAEQLHRWLHQGPPLARVSAVEWARTEDCDQTPGFRVIR